MSRYRARGNRYRQKDPYSVRRLFRGYPIGGMSGSGGYRPRISPYLNYGSNYSPETKYIPQAKSLEGYSPRLKKNELEKYLSEKAIARNEIDMEQILRELEKRFDEKLLEKTKDESGKLDKEVEKTYTEINTSNDAELDNDKEESIANKLDIEEKDEVSEDITSEEEKSEAQESIEVKKEQDIEEKDSELDEEFPRDMYLEDEAEVLRDMEAEEQITNEVEDVETIEPMKDVTEGQDIYEAESPIETQGVNEQAEPINAEELPIESFAHDIKELYTELYEIESEPIEEVEPVEETESY